MSPAKTGRAPAQAEDTVESLVEPGTPYAYVEYEEERHRFRGATAREHALETELGFYAPALNLEPPGVDAVELARGEYRKESISVED